MQEHRRISCFNMTDYILSNDPYVTVKEVQDILLYMVKEIDKVCKKNNIEYLLEGGSALGAARHGGFIPWDDDLDIAIKNSDFPRFIEALRKDLPDNFYFQCYETDKRYNVLIPSMKIRLKGTNITEANWLLRNRCKDGEGIFVDVFVLRNTSNNKKTDSRYRFGYYFLTPFLILLENIGINPTWLKDIYIKRRNKYDKINEESDFIGLDWVWRAFNRPYVFEKNDIFPTKLVKFEDIELPVANNVEKFLDIAISSSWRELPPESKRAPKHIVKIDLGAYKNDNKNKRQNPSA